MSSNLEIGFELDLLWHYLRGEMDQTKKPALHALAKIFAESGVPYAVIGGIAQQVRSADPRTTIDIDIAILDRASLPRAQLLEAGFTETGVFPHTVNWKGPEGVPVQFSDDPSFKEAIERAGEIALEDQSLRVIQAVDLVRSKLRSATEAQRRPSKKLRDLADIQELIEDDPSLEGQLTSAERAMFDQLSGRRS